MRITSISPDGKRLAVTRHSIYSDGGETTVFDTAPWRPLFQSAPRRRDAESGWPRAGNRGRVYPVLGRAHREEAAHGDSGARGRPVTVQSGRTVVGGALGARFANLQDCYGTQRPAPGRKRRSLCPPLFSPDGRLLITSLSGAVIWDFASANPIQKLGGGSTIAISPNGEWIAVAEHASIRLWQKGPAPH